MSKHVLAIFVMLLFAGGCGLFARTHDYSKVPEVTPRLKVPQTAEQDMDAAYFHFQGAFHGAKGKTQAELEEIFRIPMRDKGTKDGLTAKGWRQYGSVGVGDRKGKVDAYSHVVGNTVYTTGQVTPGTPGWSKDFDCSVVFLFDETGTCVDAAYKGDCFRVDKLSLTAINVDIE